MDFALDPATPGATMTWTKNTDIRTDMFTSLTINKGSFALNPTFGSDLYKIKKITESSLNLAKQYCQEALKWLIQVGRAKTIDVIVERDTDDFTRMNIKVTATQPNGLIVSWAMYRTVGMDSNSDYSVFNFQVVNGNIVQTISPIAH